MATSGGSPPSPEQLAQSSFGGDGFRRVGRQSNEEEEEEVEETKGEVNHLTTEKTRRSADEGGPFEVTREDVVAAGDTESNGKAKAEQEDSTSTSASTAPSTVSSASLSSATSTVASPTSAFPPFRDYQRQ